MGTQATYSWIPSTARTLALYGCGPQPRGALTLTPPALNWPPKDPTDTLDYSLDISQIIAGNEGDAIMTLDVVINPNNPGDLTLQSSSADGDLAVLWLSGGFAGTVYQVTVTIGTNGGRVIGRTINLPVIGFATLPPAQEALTDQTGSAITDQYDAPILVTD